MSTQRSNTVTRLRKQAGPAIFSCDVLDLHSATSRAQFREHIGWINDSQHSQKGYYDTWNVKVLHANYNGRFDIDNIFRSPVLLRVCVILPPLQGAAHCLSAH
jgi:hypothetical protein